MAPPLRRRRLRLASDPWYELSPAGKFCCPTCAAFCGWCGVPIPFGYTVAYEASAALCPTCLMKVQVRLMQAKQEATRLGRAEGNATALQRLTNGGTHAPPQASPA